MHKDKEFLKSCDLMDYSLLLVFFKKGHSNSPQNLQGSSPQANVINDGNFGDLSSSNRQRKMSIFVKYNADGKYLCVEEDTRF